MKRVLSTLFATLLILGGFNTLAAFAKQAAPEELVEAHEDLAQLKRMLGTKKSKSHELVAYVTVVRTAHENAEGPERDVASFRRAAEAQLVRALTKARVRNDRNQLTDVNIAAAKALTKLAPTLDDKVRAGLAKKVRRAVEGLHDARYEVDPERIEVTFVAAARLGDVRTLAWLLDEYSHTKNNEAAFLVAAHQAMVLFPAEQVPGTQRHAIVKKFKERYSGVESLAKQNTNTPAARAAKRLWDRIRTHVVKVLQHFSGTPTNESGVALSTVDEFERWFREHKSARKAPWVDDE